VFSLTAKPNREGGKKSLQLFDRDRAPAAGTINVNLCVSGQNLKGTEKWEPEAEKSLADLTAVSTGGRIEPPASLSAVEAKLFRQVVMAEPPGHFAPSDAPVPVNYVRATLWSQLAFEGGDINTWEKATRAQGLAATRLRLTPQSRSN
jgi:hypothetical protein